MPDRDTHLSTIKPRHRPAASAWRVPSLTILFHPGAPARAGEVARLVDLLDGKACGLSRLEPEFAGPGAARGKPLLDGHVSRTPVRIEQDGAGGVRLQAPPGTLRLDGVPAEPNVVVSRDALERGVVLELAERIVLLLHLLGTPAPRAPALGIVGSSEATERLRGEILRIADLDVPVLLWGEAGSGKGCVASAIAAAAPRLGPFVAVNLAALPASTAAAELFGHEAGADGPARTGAFAQARGGTLFLDQIADASLEIQAMILRAMERRDGQGRGGDRRREVDARILTATDRSLKEAIAAGRFREALYQRLCGYQLEVPPLRARRDDIGPLLIHFLGEELRALGEPDRLESLADSDPWLPPAMVAWLAQYSWPGNVRQLSDVARRLAVEGREGRRLDEHALPPDLVRDDPSRPHPPVSGAPRNGRGGAGPSSIDDQKLLEALRENSWKIGATARALRISRTSLYALIDASPSVRKAKDVPADEVRACYSSLGGDVDAMASTLRVSSRGIRLRLKELGLA